MLALPVVTPEVIGGLGHLPPQHGGEVQHLHVRLHLHCFQSIHMDFEVGVVEGSEPESIKWLIGGFSNLSTKCKEIKDRFEQ